MRNRRAATRFTLRRLVRKGKITREQAKFILSDDDATDLLSEHIQESIDEEATFASEDGPIISFIKWMIENPEKIAAFIELIMSLFNVPTE